MTFSWPGIRALDRMHQKVPVAPAQCSRWRALQAKGDLLIIDLTQTSTTSPANRPGGHPTKEGTCKQTVSTGLELNRKTGPLPDRRSPRTVRRAHRLRRLDSNHQEMSVTLRTEGLTKSFGGRTVVRNVDVDLASGEIVGLLGPNGAGKTTTFSMIVGLVGPDSGRVLLDGQNIADDPMYVRARKGIGYLPQEASIFRGLTVEQNILAILETLPLGRAERRARLQELLEELNLTPLAKSKAYTLSGGERQRVESRALVNQPKFMLLDEPFAGIDPIAVGRSRRSFFT